MEINNGHSPSKLMTLVQRRSKERYLHGPSLQFTDVDLFVAVRAFYMHKSVATNGHLCDDECEYVREYVRMCTLG
jgi:hypothetical protein